MHHNDSLTSSHTLSLTQTHTHHSLPPCTCPLTNSPPGRPITPDSHLGMQLGDEPSISQVANRFIGTGLFSAPLPGKLNRPLLSAMLAAGVPFTSSRRSEQTSPSGSRWILILPPLKRVLIRCSTETSYRSRVAQRFACGVCVQLLHAAVVRNFHTVHRELATRNCSSSHSPQEVT